MNNRLPVYILGILVLVALVWRISNPPAPPLPGPRGDIPHWISSIAIGEHGPAALNPTGEIWAGVWNHKTAHGTMESAVVIVDILKQTSTRIPLKKGFVTSSLVWPGEKQFAVLLADSQNPGLVTRSSLVVFTLTNGNWKSEETTLPTDVARIIAWPTGSDTMAVELAGSPVSTALMNREGAITGKQSTPPVSQDARFHPHGAISPDGQSYIFGVQKAEREGAFIYAFYLADSRTGAVSELFRSKDVPGMVEGLWLSDAGVLVVSAEKTAFHVLKADPASPGKLQKVGRGEVPKMWKDAPQRMAFAAFNGGYEIDLSTTKSRRILEFDTSDKQTAHWRNEVLNGRLFPRTDGDFTSVSYVAGLVDIRVIKKDGSDAKPILARR